jgi:hypothetical protein
METTLKALKEIGQFLGGKLDAVVDAVKSTPQKIQVDFSDTSKNLENLKDTIASQITSLSSVLKDSSESNNKNFVDASVELVGSIQQLEQILAGKEFNVTVPDISPALLSLKNDLVSAVSGLKPDKFDMSAVVSSMDKVSAMLHTMHEEREKPMDMQPLMACMEEMKKDMKDSTKMMEKHSSMLLDAIGKIKMKVNVPETIKIDEMQMRTISNIGGGFSVNGGILAARNVTQTNTSMTSADTEYSYTFPANTTSWQIKLRDQGVLLLYSFTTGTMPTSGTGAKYSTAPQNYIRSQEGVYWSGKTIYFQSDTASMTAEIEVFTA